MDKPQPNNPLHGVSLKSMLEDLVERRGWEDLAGRIRIRCFSDDPSIASSLKFLRKTEWARAKVERLYLEDRQAFERNRKRNERRASMRAFRAAQEAEQEAEQEASGAATGEVTRKASEGGTDSGSAEDTPSEE
jgi:uncharacterized protein (DUF2132 family)